MATLNGRSQVMKSNSRALITATIRRGGPTSRVQLAKSTGISRTHVSDVVDELIADGTLIETGCVSDKPGRPRVLLRINPNGPAAAGIWLSEEGIQIGVAAPDGEVLSRYEIAYATCTGSSEEAIAAIADGVRRCADKAGRRPDSLQGVGLAVSGWVEPVLNVIKRTRLNPCFLDVPIARMLTDQLKVPVYISADIRASALAHNWYREGEQRALYAWFMDGIGVAYVTDGQLFGSAHNMAPSVGHMIMSPDGPLCYCGRHGCLETYTTTYAFIRTIWPDIDPVSMTTAERRDLVKRGLDMAAQGDLAAIRAQESTISYMGLGIANTINLFDPQVVYIGGVLIDYSPDIMMDVIRREAMKNINRSYQGVEIRAMREVDEFGLRGALALVLLRPYRMLQEATSKMLRLDSLA